jgi:hypothetical protein
MRTRPAVTSMYSELLAASWQAAADDRLGGTDGGEAELLRHLAERKRQLGALVRARVVEEASAPADTPTNIARNIEYDMTLLRLCTLRGIACGPSRFTHPLAERRRLERALAAAEHLG